MNEAGIKAWTILIYANGNNELEPEIWQAKLDAERIGSNQAVNVVMQIGREERQLVKILRPCEHIPVTEENWSGVKRYYLARNNPIEFKDLGKINMSDPVNLYNFLVWAIMFFPARHYMLVLGGHGYQFVGAMTDYSQGAPYIMGIPEMTLAINQANNALEVKIDLLVLDICFFNFIEVMYEFGKDENHSVKNVLTYIINGPIRGLPTDHLIQIVQKNSQVNDLRQMIREIIDSLHFDLVAFEINHGKLKLIKKLINDLACCYLNTKQAKDISLYQLVHTPNPEMPWYQLAKDALNNLRSLIFHDKKISKNNFGLINIANQPTSDEKKISLYSKLGFAQNNYWTYLLSDKTFNIEQAVNNQPCLKPVPLTPQAVSAYISTMNPSLSAEQKTTIFNNLVQYKKWILR